MADLGGSVEIAGKAVGGGVGIAAAFAFFRWLLGYIAQRFDVRQARLDAQQLLVDSKVGNRLRKLEQQVGVLERVTTILIAEIRELDPRNPRLAEVHEILRHAHPVDPTTPGDMADMLGKMQ